MRAICTVAPDGRRPTLSPGWTPPDGDRHRRSRENRSGGSTHCTGMRNGLAARARQSSTLSRCRSVSDHYTKPSSCCVETTLSPLRPETGMSYNIGHANVARKRPIFRVISREPSSRQPTRSILLTASTTWRMPISDDNDECRRVCVSTPLRASIRMTARIGRWRRR